jgi:hypothetical protein
MATILDKDITRETTIKVEDREIQITLTEQQTISMKLKGMKSGTVEIAIGDLYKQLKGDVSEAPKENKSVHVTHDEEDDKPMAKNDLSYSKGDSKYLISLHDIRHSMLVTSMEYEVKLKFESFLVGLINERKAKLNIK